MAMNDTLLNFIIFVISITIFPLFIYEYSTRDPSLFFIPKASITLIIMGIIIWYFHKPDEDDDDYNKYVYEDNIYFNKKVENKNVYTNKDYCYRIDKDTYEDQNRSYTQEKLNELLRTPQFKKMYEEKGEDKENWNWQSRDRKRGKKQKDESDISSDEIEYMSVSQDD